jgi:RimJ/RimL family protein N-acetyltransferase
MSASQPWEPEGPLISTDPALSPSPSSILGSSLPPTRVRSVTLVLLTESHAEPLFTNLGGAQHAQLYKYLPNGPFDDLETFTAHMKFLISGGVFPFTIFKHDSKTPTKQLSRSDNEKRLGTPIGIICLMNIVPNHRTIEIGHVVFSPLLQRTTAATESIYLLMKHCFEDLGYRRVEWKTNNLNEPSKRAAIRLGFVFEGVFRNHMVVKGRNRDTAWFSVTDGEWPVVKRGLEGWFKGNNFDESGGQRRKLEEIRKELEGKEVKEV